MITPYLQDSFSFVSIMLSNSFEKIPSTYEFEFRSTQEDMPGQTDNHIGNKDITLMSKLRITENLAVRSHIRRVGVIRSR